MFDLSEVREMHVSFGFRCFSSTSRISEFRTTVYVEGMRLKCHLPDGIYNGEVLESKLWRDM